VSDNNSYSQELELGRRRRAGLTLGGFALIAVVVLVMSLLLWGLDSFLLFGVKSLTGRG